MVAIVVVAVIAVGAVFAAGGAAVPALASIQPGGSTGPMASVMPSVSWSGGSVGPAASVMPSVSWSGGSVGPTAGGEPSPALTVSGQPYLTAFFAVPATVPVGEPTALAVALINPSPRVAAFSFTATLPAHLTISPLGAPPRNTCGGPIAADPGGTTITTSGRAAPTVGFGGCGAIVAVIADEPGTYAANSVTVNDVTGAPAGIVDITGAAGCGQRCAALSPTLTVTPQLPTIGHFR